jgi:hypothetical protein
LLAQRIEPPARRDGNVLQRRLAPITLVVHINGWPGTGKLTIARCLARRLGGRLLDNHTLLNPAEALFNRRNPKWQELRSSIRALVLDFAAQLPATEPLILTDALANFDYDRRLFDDCRVLAERRSARLVAAILSCDHAENERRLVSAGRRELHKLTDVEVLADLRSRYTLLRPAGIDLIEIDVTALTDEEAALVLETRAKEQLGG